MKVCFTLPVFIQYVLAFLSIDKNKMEYMRYSLQDLSEQDGRGKKNDATPGIHFEAETSNPETKNEKFSFLLER